MREENAIEVRNLTKSFKVYQDKGSQLKEKLLFSKRRRYEERQVLQGISFNVKKGEAVGLIGHNGCGKSTTLKLLSKIIYPDSGSVEMRGRVSSLIELGAGFHPDMSGRENIYTNASIFGLSRKEIDARLDDIIEFSELEEFIDNPVRTYSSGMYMRLAFSVAINVDADILLIDEILAVGDVAFQAKCFNKLRKVKALGTTIVIVSHSLSQIEQICDRSIWIHEGTIREMGIPRVVDPMYLAYMSEKEREKKDKSNKLDETVQKNENETKKDNGKEKDGENDKRWGSQEIVMDKVTVMDGNGKETNSINSQDDCIIRIAYTQKKQLDDLVVGIAIYRTDQTYLYGTNTLIDYVGEINLKEKGYIDLKMESLSLNEGDYSIDLAFHRSDGFDYDFWRDACDIHVVNRKKEVGLMSICHKWEIN